GAEDLHDDALAGKDRASGAMAVAGRRGLGSIPWSEYGAAGFGAGVFAGFDDLLTIDEDIDHAGGQLMRLIIGGVIADGVGVEEHEIGVVAYREEAAF